MTTTVASISARANPWRYQPEGTRDLRLDLLRGYALAAMSVNHLGLHQSLFHRVSGQSSFLVSAAEAFLFISGFTLGWISLGRAPGDAIERLWKRTWVLYLATTGVSLGFAIVALRTDWALWAGFEAGDYGGPIDLLADVLTMKIAIGGVDILVAYVLYLLAAIAAMRLMEQGRSWLVAAAVTTLYVASQLAETGRFGLGFASFRVLVPNAPLFFGGLLIGYHRQAINDAWKWLPIHRMLDGLVLVAAVALAVLHARGWQELGWLGDLLTANNREEPLWVRESEMPLLPLLTVLLYLRAAWLLADLAWTPLQRLLGRAVLPLGEAALFTFVAHLVAIPIFLNLPGFPDDGVSTLAATAWVVAYLGSILLAVHVRRHVLAWLRTGQPRREWVRRHGPAVATAALAGVLLVVGSNPTGQSGPWNAGDDDEFFDEEFDDASAPSAQVSGAVLIGTTRSSQTTLEKLLRRSVQADGRAVPISTRLTTAQDTPS